MSRNIQRLILAVYLALGFFLSHTLHAHAYWSMGASEMATWFTNLDPIFSRTIRCAIFLAVVFSIFTGFIGWIILREIDKRNIESSIKLSVGISILLILISQVITSSVMRLLYEAGMLFVLISNAIIYKVFLTPARRDPTSKELYERLWDLIRFSIPLLIGFPALFGGVGAISAFYDTPQEFIHRQMYRHLFITLYFAVGMAAFIMWPILRQILVTHWALYGVQEEKAKEEESQQTSAPDAKSRGL